MSVSGSRPLRIGMAVYGDITYDSRVRKSATLLADQGHQVQLVCIAESSDGLDLADGGHVRVLSPGPGSTLPGEGPLLSGRSGREKALRSARWIAGYARSLRAWGKLAERAVGPVDVWHLHDLPALVAIAPRARGRAAYVYDSHEVYVDAGSAARLPGFARRLLRAYEGRLVRGSAALVTVNEPIAALLTERYRPRRTVVVHNCSPRWTAGAAVSGLLKRAAGLEPESRVVLYHGGVGRGRGIEQLLEALLEPGLEAVHLVVMGPTRSGDGYAQLLGDPRWGGRAHLLPPVPPTDLLDWVSGADIGVSLLRPTELNHVLATPNKLFECLAAGVPVVASDLPAIRAVLAADPMGMLGALTDPADPAAIATAIRSILSLAPDEFARLRERCGHAAQERWNWEAESAKLTALYAALAAAGPGAAGR